MFVLKDVDHNYLSQLIICITVKLICCFVVLVRATAAAATIHHGMNSFYALYQYHSLSVCRLTCMYSSLRLSISYCNDCLSVCLFHCNGGGFTL